MADSKKKKLVMAKKGPKSKSAPKKVARKLGRPSSFTKKKGDKIAAQVALGISIRKICEPESMPSVETFFRWLRQNDEFREQYARAKEEAADALVEEILDIADDGRNDWMEKINKNGELTGWMLNKEAVQRSRIRIDTRKWLATKLKPKKYGDKLELDNKTEHSGKVGIDLADKSDEELARIAKKVFDDKEVGGGNGDS